MTMPHRLHGVKEDPTLLAQNQILDLMKETSQSRSGHSVEKAGFMLTAWRESNDPVPFEKVVEAQCESSTVGQLLVLLDLSRKCTRAWSDVPVAGYFGISSDASRVLAQARLIAALLDVPRDIFAFTDFQCRTVVPLAECPNALSDMANGSWNCFQLYQFMVQLSASAQLYESSGRYLLERAIKRAPEFLCIALASLHSASPALRETYVKMVAGYLTGHHSSTFVLQHVWAADPDVILQCMVDMHKRDPLSTSRLLDVSLELKNLSNVLECRPWAFSIDMAILASRRQHLNLDKWLREQLERDSFVRDCIDYISLKVEQIRSKRASSTVPLSVATIDSLKAIMRVVKQNGDAGTIGAGGFAQLEDDLHSMSASGPGSVSALEPGHSLVIGGGPGMHPQHSLPVQPPPAADFHPDVENVVNGYFESLFAGQLSPEDLVKAMKNLKQAGGVHERQIFDCLVRSLFEEFKFFPNYPEKELETVAVFVGQVISSDILHPTSQSIALTFVLDAMKKQIGSRLFQFAQLSLVHFYRRVPEWLQFMESLTKSAHYEYLPEIVRSHLANAHRDDIVAASEHVDSLKAALSEGSPVREPPEKVRERIHFAINNLTEDNLFGKADEIRGLLPTECHSWFVEYLMNERIILENNLHVCYNDLIVSIAVPGLVELFMTTSLAKARRLLLSFEGLPGERRNSIQLRGILKNLAQWIGLLFFSRDRPILRHDLCIKSLLTAQANNEYYTFVLPFTCKLLEKTSLSSVLLPSNPWIASLLRLLVEIYVFVVDLKLNSKFEIELLFKSLGVDMKSVQPSSHLRRKVARPMSSAATAPLTVPSQYHHPSLPSPSTISELVLSEIGPAQIDRACAIAAKTIAALLQKDATALGSTPTQGIPGSTAAGVAAVLFEATSKEAIRSILFATYKKYLTATGFQVDDPRLIELVDSTYPTVLAAAHELIVKAMAGRPLQASSSSPPGLVGSSSVVCAYNELAEAVGRTSLGAAPSPPQSTAPPVEAPSLKDISAAVLSIISDLEAIVTQPSKANVGVGQLSSEDEVKVLMKRLVNLAASEAGNRDEACLVTSQKLVQLLFRSSSPLLIDITVVLLAKIFEYSSRVSKEVTNWILVSSDERKYNVAAMSGLLSSGLVYVLDFDVQLARQIDSGLVKAVPFAIELVRRCVLGTPPIAAPYDLVYSLEALGRVLKRAAAAASHLPSQFSGQPQLGQEAKDIMALMEDISKRMAAMDSASSSSEGKIREVVSFWFSDWFRLCQYPSDSSKQVASFLSQLSQKDAFFKLPDKACQFFRICSEVAVELFLHQKHAPSVLSLRGVECYVRLATGLATWPCTPKEGKSLIGDSELLRITLWEFSSVLLSALPQQPIVLRALTRLLICTLNELGGQQGSSNAAHRDGAPSASMLPYYTVVADLLDVLNPVDMPPVLATWIEAVSCKHFLTAWLFDHPEAGTAVIGRILGCAVDFLSLPDIVNGTRSAPLVSAYQAILRLFVGIAHDKPEVLLTLSRDLLFRLDPHFIQLRNLLLATIPSTMALPDPFAADFSFDQASLSINQPAGQLMPSRPSTMAIDPQLMAVVEGAVSKSISGAAFDVEAFGQAAGPKYFALSSLLLTHIAQRGPLVTVERLADGIAKSIKGLLLLLGTEGPYQLLFALADNLRFPCAETHFFVRLFMSLFQCSQENIREIVTRVLLERLIVHKPHPWGLIVTFLEIIKRADFWKCQFTSKTPEIQRMFESVAKTCGNVQVSLQQRSK